MLRNPSFFGFSIWSRPQLIPTIIPTGSRLIGSAAVDMGELKKNRLRRKKNGKPKKLGFPSFPRLRPVLVVQQTWKKIWDLLRFWFLPTSRQQTTQQIWSSDPPATHFDKSGHQDLLANKSGHLYHGTDKWWWLILRVLFMGDSRSTNSMQFHLCCDLRFVYREVGKIPHRHFWSYIKTRSRICWTTKTGLKYAGF